MYLTLIISVVSLPIGKIARTNFVNTIILETSSYYDNVDSLKGVDSTKKERKYDIHRVHEFTSAAIQYIPFYGGAKGQYLEVKKDTKGAILSEKVVAEESISSENIMKNTDETLLSKVLFANLQNLRSLSNNLLKIHNLGRKTGSLGNQEKTRFKSQLFSLGEAASNTIKLIDEIGDDVDVLFKKNTSLLRQYGESDDEDVGEEGIGIDSPSDSEEESNKGDTLVAVAKPVGLAVIGESGLAGARPMATAVASKGVAIARPIGTAIAGIDPSLLGINYNVNQYEKTYKYKGRSFEDF